jgi:hypothetical protein
MCNTCLNNDFEGGIELGRHFLVTTAVFTKLYRSSTIIRKMQQVIAAKSTKIFETLNNLKLKCW